jgi:hypothetical protein
MSDKIWFDPTLDKWVLSDGEHYLEVPHWAREIVVNEFEREARQLKTDNAKLRDGAYAMRQLYEDELKHALADNAKLRELVRDMWHDGMCECDERGACAECEYDYPTRMRDLGVEVDA